MSKWTLVEPGGSRVDMHDTEALETRLRVGDRGREGEYERLMAVWPDGEDDAA